METEQVNRAEFNSLKEEVNQIKQDMIESQKLLQTIERKIDIIGEKISTSNEINQLKLIPLDERVKKLESGISWLWKLCAGAIISGIITAIINFK